MAALDDEVRVIRSKMSVDARIHIRPGLITKGTYAHRPLLLVRTGLGRHAMRSTVTAMLDSHAPDLVVHVGYCGGADPSLAAGDLVVADAVVDSRTKERIVLDEGLVASAHKALEARSLRRRIGSLVTVEAVAESPHEKAFLATEHASVAIDMESFDLARVCSERSVPYIIVRAVLDPLDYEFPDLQSAVDDEGKTDGVALASHLVRRPADILKLPRIEYFASQARNAITSFVEGWLKEGAS